MSQLKRVKIWGGPVRALHWTMAAAVLLLMASGWIMARGHGADRPLWLLAHDLHVPAGAVMLVAVSARVLLLVLGQGSAGWRDLVPGRVQLQAVKGMLRFYLSAARSPLPPYYAHNPLWGPVYLLMLGLMMAQGMAGLWLWLPSVRALIDLDYAWAAGLHQQGSRIVLVLSLAHIVAAILHDWRGGRCEVSGMISGYKVFEIPGPPVSPPIGGVQVRVKGLDQWTPPPG